MAVEMKFPLQQPVTIIDGLIDGIVTARLAKIKEDNIYRVETLDGAELWKHEGELQAR